MDVYLVQHGTAVSEEEDPLRPLSVEGRTAVARMAEYLTVRATRLIDPPILEVRHSGKLRARQTAEILARAICPQAAFIAADRMNPKDDPRHCCDELTAGRDRPGAIMLVGHLPYLARLAGMLLAGSAEAAPVRFVNAGVVKLCPGESGWAVEWYFTPECVQ